MSPKVTLLAERVCEGPELERASALASLIEMARDSDFAVSVFSICVDLSKEEILKESDLAPHAAALSEIWNELYNEATVLQGEPTKIEWRLDDEYEPLRGSAEWLLDLLGYIPGDVTSRCLREALKLSDPLLKLFAAVSLIRRLEHVDLQDLDRIAADNETRILLSRQLRRLGMESLMPEKWSTPALLAESQLSVWASNPCELGALPEEVELMGTFPVEAENQTLNVFLFRFREYPKPWEAGEGWMAGIAGPYRNGESIGSPWSAFERWDSRSPEEHFARLYWRNRTCQTE